MRALVLTAVAAGLCAVPSNAQVLQDQFLDIFTVKVKPDRRADFDAVARKIADANRRYGGDRFFTLENVYGESHVLSFVSTRRNMAAIDTAMDLFKKAMTESFGQKFESVFREAEATLISSRSELRQRRMDLSVNAPKSDEEYGRIMGNARWLRVTALQIRPGHAMEFEDLAKMVKGAIEKSRPQTVALVSQSLAGQEHQAYYLATPAASLADFDQAIFSIKDVLSEEDYARYTKVMSEAIGGSEVTIARMVPELSNPPEAFIQVSRDFWTPKMQAGSSTGSASRTKPPARKTGQ